MTKRIIEYPFHLGDLIGGTAHLDNAEFGAYMRLLLANIQAPNSELPDNLEELRRYARCTEKQWAKFWPLVERKFPLTGRGTRTNERVTDTVASITHRSNVARDNRLKRKGSGHTAVKPPKNEVSANHITLEDISNDISSPGGVLVQTTEPEKRSPKTIEYTIDNQVLTFEMFFEKFWNHYPKIRDKGHKGKARDALFLALQKRGKHEENWRSVAGDIAAGVRRFRRYCDRTGEKNPDAFRWLRDGGFNRPYDAAVQGRSGGYSLEAVHDQALADITGRSEGREGRLKGLGLDEDTGEA